MDIVKTDPAETAAIQAEDAEAAAQAALTKFDTVNGTTKDSCAAAAIAPGGKCVSPIADADKPFCDACTARAPLERL
ncbi:MAG: hypothetical protein U1F42_04905 [Candidatus Competibacteraceae bacterium]